MRILALPLLLAGCFDEPGHDDCAWPSGSNNFEPEQPAEHDGLAWRLDLPEPGLDYADLSFYTTNLSEDSDCVVALYASDEAPDPAALPALDPLESPPEAIEGIGELIDAVNLSRS